MPRAMTEAEGYIELLEDSNPLREPTLREAVHALQIPAASRGLDVGCGIGLQTLLLAEAVGSAGHVTGLDLSPVFLSRAVKIVKHSPLGAQISLLAGDRSRLPFADNSFDWVWSADCVGYPAGDGPALLTELSRVTRPGGQVAVLGWSSQQLLPGYSRREAYLNAHCARVASFLEGKKPEDHFARGLEWFRAAGLRDVSARTLIGQVTSPLESDIRRAMIALFGMLWGASLQSASPEDREAYQRLCSPGSDDFILDISQYYGFFTYSMFQGRVHRPRPDFL